MHSILLKKAYILLPGLILLFVLNLPQAVAETSNSREAGYEQLIQNASHRHNLHPCLIKAVIWRESRFNPMAIGKAGEIGIMQITMAATTDWAKAHHTRRPTRQELFQPKLNIEIGSWYLAQAKRYWQRTSNPYVLAVCEYNAGRRGMKKLISIRRDGRISIASNHLHKYAYSVIKRYYHYLALRNKKRMMKKLAYEGN